MGIIADNAAEVVARHSGNAGVSMTDLRTASQVEVLADSMGKVWINVDGVCLLRVAVVNELLIDTSNRGQDGVTIRST